MTVTILALLTVNESEPRALAEYFKVTSPLLERAGAKIIKRFNINEVVVGHKPAMTTILVEYPDREAVDLVFESDEYKSIKSVRDRAFSTYEISIVASDDDTEAASTEADQS